MALLVLQPVRSEESPPEQATIRILLPVAPSVDTECALLTRNGGELWQEHASFDMRPAFISKWVVVPRTELGFSFQVKGQPLSIADFTLPDAVKRALVIVLPGEKEGQFKTHVVDVSTTEGFGAGKVFIVNLSDVSCVVSLGGLSITSKPGDGLLAQPSVDANGMYRQLVGYEDTIAGIVTSYDRFIRGNPSSRGYLLLLHHAEQKVRVVSMSEFAPFE